MRSVVLIDDQPELGGHLRIQTAAGATATRASRRLAGREAAERLAGARRRASRASGTSPRATAVGIYEGRLVAVSQGETLHPRPRRPDRRRHRRARAARCSSTTTTGRGSCSRRRSCGCGSSTASAIGERVVVVTDDDHGWRQAAELVAAGFEVAAPPRLARRAPDGAVPAPAVRPPTRRRCCARRASTSASVPCPWMRRGTTRVTGLRYTAAGSDGEQTHRVRPRGDGGPSGARDLAARPGRRAATAGTTGSASSSRAT